MRIVSWVVGAAVLAAGTAGAWRTGRAAVAIAGTEASLEETWAGRPLNTPLAGIRVRRLDGGAPADSLDLGTLSHAVVFVFDPGCAYTGANMANWTDVVREAPEGAPLYALTFRQTDADRVLGYWDGMHGRVRTLGTDTATMMRRMGVAGTPTTLVVRHGVIRHKWHGVLQPRARAALLRELYQGGE